ncbi:CubicO group peptidase, beta-lactamase class C family [Actinacidiphila yanglinensis]|uniref:Beta-lactamase n=1 Tax=Actinacidiphila yanglinensis TaxID=310779 RepID=A0A1H6CWD4_9ACTN|nr:serine hydrolase domain-containing protein [Actinacidiphila yanglinensis]SEG77023.1 CubicO group peptidase, beta-lactamase class C family [Actinacidiphila yanglinensis]
MTWPAVRRRAPGGSGAATGADGPRSGGPLDRADLAARLERALAQVRAPDVVVGVSRAGRRTVATGGTATPRLPRTSLHYELGSLSKTFTVLLLAELAREGAVRLDDPLAAYLPGLRLPHPSSRAITLRHLATHTSGLPRVPRDLIPGALLRPYTNGYAGYDRERLLRTFARTRTRHAPGTRWRYSNFGLALLGPALESATGTGYPALLTERVLRPLGLDGAAIGPAPGSGPGAATAAIGHRPDGRTPLPPTDMAAFTPAGAIRATPGDLLRYAEAHLSPDAAAVPAPLREALRDVQVPLLRRGMGHRHTHTLTWYLHPAPRGPILFHAGATFGHQSFLGFHPAGGSAVVGTATRHDRSCALIPACYELLSELASSPADKAPEADGTDGADGGRSSGM